MKLILASSSPRRRRLLEREGIELEIVPSNALESSDSGGDPANLVKHNALVKAKAVYKKLGRGPVLGADTVVVLDGEVIGKPHDLDEAYATLRKLSGRTHTVFTGIAIVDKDQEVVDYDQGEVTFKQLDDNMIKEYFSQVNPLDKAGAYAAQNEGMMIIEKIEGDETNIIGLPMRLLKSHLSKL